MNSLTQQFIAEVHDYLDEAARGFLSLEQSSHDQTLINSLFRNFHTIKGTSGIFPEFSPITSLTHVAEDLMDKVRSGEREITPVMIDLFLETLDLLSGWITAIESTEALPPDAAKSGQALGNRISSILEICRDKLQVEVVSTTDNDSCNQRYPIIFNWLSNLDAANHTAICELANSASGTSRSIVCYTPDPDCFFFGEDPVNLFRQIDGIDHLQAVVPDISDSSDTYDPFRCSISFIAVVNGADEVIHSTFGYVIDQITLLPLAEALALPASPAESVDKDGITIVLNETATASSVPELREPALPPHTDVIDKKSASFIRVDQQLINRLMDLVGEIIIAKNGLPYLCQRADKNFGAPQLASEIDSRYTTINHIVGGLQDVAMEMRMLPVAKAFERFPRLVRDISRKLGKNITLVMEGEDTSADKDIIDALSEPLVHLVRNSLDHGIESPEQRRAAGKDPEGKISLRAAQENASIVVEIHDDGKGIDPEIIRKKALEKAIASSESLNAMSDEDVIQLVMAPNFSTADKVTDLSGRGVGMDAVSAMVTSFGGSIRLSSIAGFGSTVRLTLPLSMAITKVLIIRQGDCTFGIPADCVIESLIDIPHSQINTVRALPGLNVRGELLPLYSLERRLAVKTAHPWFVENFSAVVVRVRGEIVAIGVEGFNDIIDVVVKPLHGMMAHVPYYSGCTILGDGSIMFILNLAEVITDAG